MAAARGYPGPLVTRQKAFRSLHASFRKGRARGGLGHTGQRRDAHIARCGYRTSCATGMEPGSAVPASTTRDVRRRGRAWQRLLQPTRRGRSVTRGAARRRPFDQPMRRFCGRRESNTAIERVKRDPGRSWPERKQGHPSHEARTARTGSGRAGRSLRTDGCVTRAACICTGAVSRVRAFDSNRSTARDDAPNAGVYRKGKTQCL